MFLFSFFVNVYFITLLFMLYMYGILCMLYIVYYAVTVIISADY